MGATQRFVKCYTQKEVPQANKWRLNRHKLLMETITIVAALEARTVDAVKIPFFRTLTCHGEMTGGSFLHGTAFLKETPCIYVDWKTS